MGGPLRRWPAIARIVSALLLSNCSSQPDTDEIAAWVKDDLQSYLQRDSKRSEYWLQVMELSLVHASGNEYKGGFATARTRRHAKHKVGGF